VITNDVGEYVNLLVRIAHINCNRPLHYVKPTSNSISFLSECLVVFPVLGNGPAGKHTDKMCGNARYFENELLK